MWFFLRQIAAIVVLPVMMTVVIPLWIARRYDVTFRAPTSLPQGGLAVLGSIAILVGLGLFGACLWQFAIKGKGTLAPWDPPRTLVTSGPYRFVRNPMISGIVLLLAGEAAVLRSSAHAWWLLIFVAVNLPVIIFVEEPLLERRFGESYRQFKNRVPRLFPRARGWHGSNTSGPRVP